jgi:hypothetical protein
MTFDGDALADHEMDIRELAPALLNAADFFKESNRQLHPTEPDIQVNIRGTNEGSFLVQLKMMFDDSTAGLTSEPSQQVVNLLTLLSFFGGMIKFLVQKHRSGEPTNSVESGDEVTLEWPDGVILRINRNVPRLSEDPSIRRPLNGMLKPLQRDGIDSIKISRSDDEIEEVTSDDLPAIEGNGSDDREILNESTFQRTLTIRSISWQIGQKWRFSDGQSTFYAEITDKEFNARIESREAFAKGDELEGIIHSVQYRDVTGIHAEVQLTKVLGHLAPPDPPYFVLGVPTTKAEREETTRELEKGE